MKKNSDNTKVTYKIKERGPFGNKSDAKKFAKKEQEKGNGARYYQKGPTNRWYVKIKKEIIKKKKKKISDVKTLNGKKAKDIIGKVRKEYYGK